MLTGHVIHRSTLAAAIVVVILAAGSSVGLAEAPSQGAGSNVGSGGGNFPSIGDIARALRASALRGRLALSISGKTQPGEGAAPYVPQKGSLKTNVCNFQHVCD